jgi:metal-responsive CopG/Arc/MetJ family transcriptional regulator
MPAEKGDKQAVTIWIDKNLVKQIDLLAGKGDLTRSKLIANLVEIGAEELMVMNKVGIWAMARIYENIRQRLKMGRSKKKEEEE